jgi:hypothetical protein
LHFREAGELAAQPERATDDRCRASCMDWYGNARRLCLLPLIRGSIAEDLGMRDEASDTGRRMPVGRFELPGDVAVALCAAGMVQISRQASMPESGLFHFS